MKAPYYDVDAFADTPFAGNPAAVVLLAAWPPDGVLQRMAAEHYLSEAAFVVRGAAGCELRWFTPTVEVDLCGHATLAAAHVLFRHAGHSGPRIAFASRSGPLGVEVELKNPSRGAPRRTPPGAP